MHQSVSIVIADLDQLQIEVNELLAIPAGVEDLGAEDKTNLVSSFKRKTTENHGR